jgi:hypothetical protein
MEGRLLLSSSLGAKFTYGSRITYSFMPDGTNIGGVPSNLFQTLNAVTSTANWQLQFEKAAAVWEQVANVNLALVPDDGAPVGSGGYQQGDPGMGDIRFGAISQSGSVLSMALLPPSYNGGSDSGDIILNSSQPWHVGSNYDLETVAIHEIGHVLGMGHSQIASADMYAYYQYVKQTLSSDDVAGIQSIWGAAPADTGSNQTMSNATDTWSMYAYQNNLQATISGVSIANNTDYQWYRVFVPWNTSGQLTVTMQSTGLSSLSPRVALYSSNNVGLMQASMPNSYGATIGLTYSVSPGEVYYIRASSANGGPGSNGAYALQINLGSGYQPAASPPNTTIAAQPDQGGGSSADSVSQQSGGHGLLGGLLNVVDSVVQDVAQLVHLGSLSAYGEALSVSPQFRLRQPGLNPGAQDRSPVGPVGHHVHGGTAGPMHNLIAAAHDRALLDLAVRGGGHSHSH